MPVIGFVSGYTLEAGIRPAAAFRSGLNQAGYDEGQNVTVEYHWLEGRYDQLPSLISDLVRRKVVLVVIDTAHQQMESHVIKEPATAATVARPEARYADQPFDSSLLHRGDEHLGRLREKPRRLEDDFGSS